MSHPEQDAFESTLVAFIRDELPTLGARERGKKRREPEGTIDAETLLFKSGYVDSLGFIHLLATIEEILEISIPEERIVMRHFRTVRAVWEAFGVPRVAARASHPC